MAPSAHNPPPGDVGPGDPEEIADGSGSARKAGFGGDFAVGHDLPRLKAVDDGEDGVLEVGHTVPNRRSPMSPSPGAM